MKKIILISVFLMLVLFAFAQTPTRVTQQKLALDPTHPMLLTDYVTNTGNTHSEHYILRVQHVETGEERGSDLGAPVAALKIAKVGNAPNQYVAAIFNQSMWPAVWPIGSHVKIRIWHVDDTSAPSGIEPYPNYEYVEKTFEVPTGGGVISFVNPEDILIIPPAPPVTPEFQFFVNSNYPDAAIYRDGVDTGEVTPYTFVGETDELAGVYSLVLENVVWTPESYSYDGLADHTITFEGVMTPGYASNPVPADGVEIPIAWDADPIAYELEWDAPALAPTGYKVFWMGEEVGSITETTWTTPAIAEGSYNWKVVPYITDPVLGKSIGNRNLPSLEARFASPQIKGEVSDAPVWSFTIIREEAPDYPAGVDTDVATGVTVNTDEDLANVVITPDNAALVLLANYDNLIDPIVLGFSGTGNDVTISFNISTPGTWYALAYWGGAWHEADVYPLTVPPIPGTVVFSGVDFTAKGDVIVVIDEIDGTLPVELSSFSAVLTANNFVKLTWVSQSETEMLGYRVYRSEQNNQAASLLITPSMIPATNTSITQSYSIEDKEVEVGSAYWYWLESVDYASTHFHGPVSVIVNGEVPPVLPTVTTMSNAYPNPFKQARSTSIDVSIKAGEAGTVTIYNILGQAVKSFKVTEGTHKISWNGKDSRGNNCGSGIYFYKLSTPSTNMTKKMVIVK